MAKQNICIIGGGLTGLITAITLSKLNFKVDLITEKFNKKVKQSNRTSAISQSAFNFLKKLNFLKITKKNFWPCSNMKLYVDQKKNKFEEIFDMDKDKKLKKNIFYMMNNSALIEQMLKYVKKNKYINFKSGSKISTINDLDFLKGIKLKNNKNLKYNLVIICTGSNSNLSKTIFGNNYFRHSYKEISATTIIQHIPNKNNSARQIFLDNEIIALLPISENKTSIVYTAKSQIINYYKNKTSLKKRIIFFTKDFYKKTKIVSKVEFRNLNLLIRKKYYQERTILFGDALHEVHPFVGQGFNMTLRDLMSLENTLRKKINLGLDVGTSNILLEFSNKVKPRNFLFSLGIDFMKNCFSYQKQTFKNLRNDIIIKLNKNTFIKNIFFDIADEGFKF